MNHPRITLLLFLVAGVLLLALHGSSAEPGKTLEEYASLQSAGVDL